MQIVSIKSPSLLPLFCLCARQSYKMDASPCGHCLIINNVEFDPQSELSNRRGSNIDCDKLESRFKALNFIVDVKTNLKQRVRIPVLGRENHMQTFLSSG